MDRAGEQPSELVVVFVVVDDVLGGVDEPKESILCSLGLKQWTSRE